MFSSVSRSTLRAFFFMDMTDKPTSILPCNFPFWVYRKIIKPNRQSNTIMKLTQKPTKFAQFRTINYIADIKSLHNVQPSAQTLVYLHRWAILNISIFHFLGRKISVIKKIILLCRLHTITHLWQYTVYLNLGKPLLTACYTTSSDGRRLQKIQTFLLGVRIHFRANGLSAFKQFWLYFRKTLWTLGHINSSCEHTK